MGKIDECLNGKISWIICSIRKTCKCLRISDTRVTPWPTSSPILSLTSFDKGFIKPVSYIEESFNCNFKTITFSWWSNILYNPILTWPVRWVDWWLLSVGSSMYVLRTILAKLFTDKSSRSRSLHFLLSFSVFFSNYMNQKYSNKFSGKV